MAFEIGDKVQTVTGLYTKGAWRDQGLKGKVVESPNEYGSLTVKFKGMDDLRVIRPEYVILRSKKKRPFKEGDTVALTQDIFGNDNRIIWAGADAEVLEVIPDSNLVRIEFLSGDEYTVSEDNLSKTEAVEDEPADPDFVPEVENVNIPIIEIGDAQLSPEILEAFNQIMSRLDEIKELLTAGPRQEFHVTVNEASFVTPEEEPAPEPVFKKAKEVKAGDLLYTEGGAYDKVDRIETKDSGYTSLYGMFGNKITQVPSGRVVQVLEEVS